MRWPLIAGCVLLIGGTAVYFNWWDRYVETGLGQWAVAEIAERSGGVYSLQLGDLDFRPVAGSMSFDSAIIVYRYGAGPGARRPPPGVERACGRLPDLEGQRAEPDGGESVQRPGHGVRKRTYRDRPRRTPVGRRFVARFPSSSPSAARDSADSGPRRVLRPPLGIEKFQIANLAFENLQFSLRRMKLKGAASFEIAHARLVGQQIQLDVTAVPGSQEAFSSVGLRLEARHLLFKPDSVTALSLEGIDIGLTDSTLSVSRLKLAPTVTDEEWRRHQKVRHDRIRFSLDTLAAVGVAYRRLVRTGEVHMRRLMLRGALLDVLSDKRLRAGPKKRHASPQANAQQVDPVVRVDTIVVDSSQVSYQERKPDRDRPGRLDFASLAVRINDFHLPSSGAPLTIDVERPFDGGGRSVGPCDGPTRRTRLPLRPHRTARGHADRRPEPLSRRNPTG